VAGAGVAAGFAPYEYDVALVAGLALFVVCLDGVSARTGALLGAVFGAVFTLLLTPWLRRVGTDAWILICLLEAVFYAAYGAGHTVLRRWATWPVLAAFWWVAVEAARTRVPFGGFPWGRLAFSVPDGPFEAWPRWLGVPVTSGLVFMVGCMVGAGVVANLRRSSLRSAAVPLLAAVLVSALSPALPTGLAYAESDGGRERTVTVALVQGNVPGTGAEGLGEQRAVVVNHVEATRRYAEAVDAGRAQAADLVIWPENGSDIDPFTSPEVGRAIQSAVDAVGVPTLIGAILDGPEVGQGQNTGIAWTPQDGAGERYVKQHLVPFGEYIPFRSQLAPYISRLDQIPRDMVPGDDPGVLELGSVLVGDMICFDVAYDDVVRAAGAAVSDGGSQLLVVQTNNATYLGTGQPQQQWEISQVAAIQTGRDLAVASINGISGVASADGGTVLQGRSGVSQVLTEQVRLASGATWGVRAGGWLELVASVIGGALVLAGALRRRRPPAAQPTAGAVRTDEAAVLETT
jgi:apolipoprotein N-acyltransferase